MGQGLFYVKEDRVYKLCSWKPGTKGKRPVQSLSDDIGFLLLATVILQALTQMKGLQVSAEFRYQGRVLVSK